MSPGSATQHILTLRNVTKSFGRFAAVTDVDLDIAEGEFFTLVGPSGSGKTTILRMLAGFEEPTTGEIALHGKRINEVACNLRPTCMVFQTLALFNHMTVGQNIEYSQKIRGVDRATRKVKCLELMQVVRLPEGYYRKPVTQCSGGERQRVALARALALGPEILFFDEPLSAIDYRLRKLLEKELKDLHRETGKTFVYITHSLEEAMVMSDRIAIMNAGRIVQVGTPEAIYNRPASRFVAEFMGEVNVFTIQAVANGIARCVELDLEMALPCMPPGTSSGFIVVRPERVRFIAHPRDADFHLPCRLLNHYSLGSRSQFQVAAREHLLLIETALPMATEVGAELTVGWNAADCIYVPE